MNIFQEKTDELTAILTVNIGKEDYEARVRKALNDYSRKARMDGFRPGKVPPGLIKKMHGKAFLIEEINKILSESISKYLSDNKVAYLGEPLPREDEANRIDWDRDTSFKFVFDLGLAPALEIIPTKKDKVTVYTIQTEDKMVEETISNYARRFGKMEPVEYIEGDEILQGDLSQVDENGQLIENGIRTENTSFTMEVIKDDSLKTQLTGRKAGESVVFDVKKALPNEVELASVLKIDKEKIPEIAPNFRFDINAISRFRQAEINQELMDKVFGEGKARTVDEFKSLILKDLEEDLERQSEYKLAMDMKTYFLKKHKFDLPVEFLKRWILSANKEKVTEEQVNKDFPSFENDLRWQLIRNEIIKNNKIEVKPEEVTENARNYTRLQFMRYGMAEVPGDMLENYTRELLKRDDEREKIIEKLKDDKVITTLRELVTLERKKITFEKFKKLYDK
jgi:trigger factor